MTSTSGEPRPSSSDQPKASQPDPSWISWLVRLVAVAGIVVVAWAVGSGWGAIVHGHPLYGVLLVATLAGSVFAVGRTLHPRPRRRGWRRVARIGVVLVSIGWISLMAWLRPFTAVEPALEAMSSDTTVTVADYPTQIVMTPTGSVSHTGVFFQPGAKVDARAYAAILRPLAEAGFTVVIPKQPLGIALMAITTFDATKPAYPAITRWVVGGHSLGGTVAAMQAHSGDSDPVAPVVGLLLYASYPATDISSSLRAKVLSIAASNDGLATPAKIEASRSTLPAGTTFTTIDGAVHAFFGDYGPQPGDGTPTVSQDDTRTLIAHDSVEFVRTLSP